jgi:outer membrane protein assembly factor BamB
MRLRTDLFVSFGAVLFLGTTLAADRPPEAAADAWPMARGCVEGTGRSAAVLAFPLRERWQRRLEKTAFEATPVIADGTVYVGDLDGTFHALDLETGATRWSFTGEAGYSAAAACASAIVVAGDAVGVVRAFDAATGKVAWEYECEGEISGGPSVLPAAHTDGPMRILVGSQDASLTCLSADGGVVIWKHSIADQIRCTPTVAAGRVLIAGCDGKLHAIDADSGKPVGDVAIDGPTGTTPASLGKAVFFGSEGGTFYGIDVGDGGGTQPTILWQQKSAGGGQSYRSSAAIAEGAAGMLAIVGTRGRAVEAFDASDGTRAWRAAMRGKVDASPVIVGSAGEGTVAIAADTAGRVAALRTTDGSTVWEFDAGRGFTGSPAVAGGRVVMAGEDGTIWCFGTDE